jgi:hypothetical protein
MTLRAGVYVHFFNCGVDFHYIAARAADSGLTIFWMYIFFHCLKPFFCSSKLANNTPQPEPMQGQNKSIRGKEWFKG